MQLALIGRYVGTRRELIDAVFDDLSASLAQELVNRPLEQISFERDSTMGRWIVVLHHLVVTGPAGPHDSVIQPGESPGRGP